MFENELKDIFVEKEGLTKAEKKEIKKEVKENLKKEELTKKNIGIREELTTVEKISNFFDKIEFLGMKNEQKEEVALKVKEDAAGDKLYWIEIFLSSLIAALGLLQNSVAVVIGAMLIAPLLRPINGISFAVARGAGKFFVIAFRVLLFSIFASIFMGYVVASVVGVDINTNEVIARSSPNLIDFFIAIFSAMIAVMSLRFTRLGESIAGVAMAASLMPPLVVIGIALAVLNMDLAFGAMMLFMANLVAIVIVGTIFFWLYGFTPHIEKQQKYMFRRLVLVIISVVIIMIPLVSSFIAIKSELEIRNKIDMYLSTITLNNSGVFSISDININKIDNDNLIMSSTIKLSENTDIEPIIKDIDKNLGKVVGKDTELDLEVIRVVSVKSRK